ncbi:MAG: cytochrome b [Azospirillaceae bacterium]
MTADRFPMRNTPHRYGAVAMAFHWVLAIAVVGLIVVGMIMTDLPPSQRTFEIFQLHKSIGFVVFVLALGRLAWRLANPVPPLPDGLKTWERGAAHLTHYGLYVLLIAQPVVGWLASSASTLGIQTVVFGVLPLPDAVSPDEALYERLSALHGAIGWAFVALVALHVAAALKHHFVLRDDVLRRMLPGTRVPPRRG